MIRPCFSEKLSGRIHILPESRCLAWLEYSPANVTVGIATVAFFGKKWLMKKIPTISDPTIVIECHLIPFELKMAFEGGPSVAEHLTKELTGIMADCGVEVRETRLVSILWADQRVFISE
jgi:hypothetical protein